jgi:hypothetical protein
LSGGPSISNFIAKTIFLKNISQAEKILNVIKIKEEIQPLRNLKLHREAIRPVRDLLARTRPASSPIAQIARLVDETVEIALPLLIVFSVSCLEHFLKEIRKNDNDNLSEMIEDFRQEAEIDLVRDVHEIRIKRNIIIHSPQHRVGNRNLREFLKYQIEGYSLGMKLRLGVNQVKEDLNKLKEFANAIS